MTAQKRTFEFILTLSLPFPDTTKFFGFELGAQCMCDAKNDKYVVNGKHDADALAKILDVFIDKFLLCGRCRNPETTMEVQKNGNIQMRCMACGEATAVDMKHRLAAHIVKNPPSATRYQKAEKAVAERQANKAGNAEGGIDGAASTSDDKADGGTKKKMEVFLKKRIIYD